MIDKVLVVWAEKISTEVGVYAQRMSADGSRQWTKSPRINQNSGPVRQIDPEIATYPASGQFLVVWDDRREGNGEVYAQKFDANGNRLWLYDVRVNTQSMSFYQGNAAVAIDAAGQAVIVWEDCRNGKEDIYAQKLDSSGNRLWPGDVRVNSDSISNDVYQFDPNVALDSNGQAVIVWNDYRDDPSRENAYAQKLDEEGNKLWPGDRKVNSTAPTSAYSYSTRRVAVNTGGQAYVTWSGERKDDVYSRDIYVQKLDNNGNRLWAVEKIVNENTHRNSSELTITIDTSGQVYIVWEDTPDYYVIYAQKLSAQGDRLWASDVQVSPTENLDNEKPSAVVDHNQHLIITWEKSAHLFMQKLDSTGTKLWISEIQVDDSRSLFNFWGPGTAVDSSGSVLVAWTDFRNANDDIYVQKINSVGNHAWAGDLQVVYPDRYYVMTGTAQSLTIDTEGQDITQATLTGAYNANGGTIQFYLSNNGGANWESITPGVAHIFTTRGSDLRWKIELSADPQWRNTPQVNSLRVQYTAQVPGGDGYETDDTCDLAHSMAVNGASQAHTLHKEADQYWIWFNVTEGTEYVAQTANAEANADMRLYFYPSCTQPPSLEDDNDFGKDAHITWKATFSGKAYVRATNHDPKVYGDQTGYNISVRTAIKPVVVIVGGHDDNYGLQSNINHMGDQAYRTFINAGVSTLNLRYLSPSTNRDVNGDGVNDIYAATTAEGVRQAIETWAPSRGVALGVPFYLYLVDHGGQDQFLADGTNGKIAAVDLDLWLSNLEATTNADNINVIIEACKSGSFINITQDGPASISGANRVVISSTANGLNAYPSGQGGYFSDMFWTMIGQSKDIKTSFQYASQAVQEAGVTQVPWMDDNGDKVANDQDGLLASGRGLGASFAGSPPVIDWVVTGKISNQRVKITSQVRDDFGVQSAWVVVYPPDFVEPIPGPDGTTPILNLTTIALSSTGTNQFTQTLTGFVQSGIYRLVIYAQDGDGEQAMPKMLMVKTGTSIYLPVVQR